MEYYVAGWDGGGTKTAMQVRNINGEILLDTETGGINFNSSTEEELKAAIHTLIEEMSKLEGGLEACKMLCISTAGISNPQASAFLKRVIREAGLFCEIKIIGDQEGALYGALGKSVGMVLISGTGSICFGKNASGTVARTGGWGHLIDDEGSGYAIGRDILSAAVKSYDKRIQKSILYDMVIEKIGGVSVEDIIRYTYKATGNKKDIAALAPILIEAIREKDQEAIEIGNKAASALVQLVLPVAWQLGFEHGELAFTGGILTHFDYISERVKSQLLLKLPGLQILKTKQDNVTGVTLLALDILRKSDTVNFLFFTE